jgi:SAM-dependent methyltransferase
MSYKNIDKKGFELIDYTKMAKLYDMLYSWFRDYNLEANFLHKIFCHHDTKINSALDVGCGTGNHALPLQPCGYHIVGIDISHEMLSIAKSKSQISPNISLVQGDIINPPLREGYFDAAYALFSLVYNFYPFDILLRFFFSIKKLLKPNGLFVLEVLNKENYRKKYQKPQLYYLGSHEWAKNHIQTYVYPHFDKNSLLHMNLFHIIRNRKGGEFRLRTKHVRFMYDIKQLKLAAMENSLEQVEVYGDFNFQLFDNEESESSIIVFRSNGEKQND